MPRKQPLGRKPKVRVVRGELRARNPILRMVESRETRADPENRRELAPSSRTPCLKTLTYAPVALSAFLDRSS